MGKQTRTYLKSKYETGDKPTQQDFSDWLDTILSGHSTRTEYNDFAGFLDNALRIANPSNTFDIIFRTAAITADRQLNIPLLTTDDTIAVLSHDQVFTGRPSFNKSSGQPFNVQSQVIVANLNADMVDGLHANQFGGVSVSNANIWTALQTFDGDIDLQGGEIRGDPFFPTGFSAQGVLELRNITEAQFDTGGIKLYDADGSHYIRFITGNLTANKDFDFNAVVVNTGANTWTGIQTFNAGIAFGVSQEINGYPTWTDGFNAVDGTYLFDVNSIVEIKGGFRFYDADTNYVDVLVNPLSANKQIYIDAVPSLSAANLWTGVQDFQDTKFRLKHATQTRYATLVCGNIASDQTFDVSRFASLDVQNIFDGECIFNQDVSFIAGAPIFERGMTVGGLATDLAYFEILGDFYSGVRVRGIRAELLNVNVNYTPTDLDVTILVDASGGNRTITLPACGSSNHVNRIYHIMKKDSSANTVTIDGNGSETINGALTKVLTTQYECVTVHNDGSNWYIIN